jgi:hypothetical protein
MHTMYIDKPMRGHGLMQAIARVNRVFRDKPAGLGSVEIQDSRIASGMIQAPERERSDGPFLPE